jgi:hypothetical protein
MSQFEAAERRGSTAPDGRDDRVLPVTRWVARVVTVVLAAAFLVLYGLPGRTTELFAWTIRPEMTPVVMGAGYGAGVYFFYRVATIEEFHRVAPVFPGIAVFTWAMALATLLHWENFNHTHYTFVLWVFLYAVTPVLVPALWVLNRRTDPGPRRDAVEFGLPRPVRAFGVALGVVLTVVAVVLFVSPEPMIGSWPWAVSPLTARVLAGWFALFGVVTATVSLDPRWSAARILVQAEILGFAGVLAGVLRFPGNFDPSTPLSSVVIGGMALYLVGLVALYVLLERRVRSAGA